MDDQQAMRLHSDGAIVRVQLDGELDLAMVTDLRTQLDGALARTRDGGCLIVDLTEVRFMDCVALSALIHAGKVAMSRRIELQIVGDSGPVARLLEVTQLRPTLTAIWSRGNN